MSSHFIKYAVLASYLEPKIADGELIDALRSHFPIYAQRAMLGANISTNQEAIDFLKRLEMVEGNDTNRRSNTFPNDFNPMPNKGPQHGQRNDKYRPNQQFVRQMRYEHRNNYLRDNCDRRSGHHRQHDSFENGRESSSNYSTTRLILNPAAPDFETSTRQVSNNGQSETAPQLPSGNSH
jgi:hypothetical protein